MHLLKYKAAVIGGGWIGIGYSPNSPTMKPDNHADAYKANPRIEYLGHWDERWRSLPLATDIVSVCTPTETHKDIVITLAPMVKGILCEKPMATTLQDADEMIKTCRKYGTILQVNYQRHFMTPVFRFSRDSAGHMFDLLQDLFGPIKDLTRDCVRFCYGQTVLLEYVDTSDKAWEDAHIFEFDATHNNERMIPASIENIIRLLDEGRTDSNAEQARESLRLELLWKELRRTPSLTKIPSVK